MMSGAADHTYGNHNVWQMWEEGREPVSWARTNWKAALNHEGATHMGFMRKLFEARSWYRLQPDQTLILNDNPEGPAYQMDSISVDKDFALFYDPYGKALSVDLGRIRGDQIKAWWYNPRDGEALPIGTFNEKKTAEFTPHASGRGSDWILILENNEETLLCPDFHKHLSDSLA